MKSTVLILLIGLFMGMNCLAEKGSKIPPQFPEAMSAAVREQYTKEYDKGQILYDINCGKCHTTYERKKKMVPDFTAEQMEAYKVRISNPKHESEIPETTVTAEELSLIMTFIAYKKKN